MENTYIELIKQTKRNKIIAFGCGDFFRRFLMRYPLMKGNIEFIIDNYAKGNNYKDDGINIPIYSPACLVDIDLDKFVIVFFADNWREMKEQMDRILGKEFNYFYYPFEVDYIKERELNYYHRVVIPIVEVLEKNKNLESILNYAHLSSKEHLVEKLKSKNICAIPRLPVVLTPKCSLRCKECSNLMWKFETYKELSAERIIDSLRNVINCFDFIPSVELIGGEPFIASNMKEVLDFLIAEKKVLNIEITTNATLLPQKCLIENLKNNKVLVRISDYSSVISQDRFIECMKDNQINFEKIALGRWVAPGGIEKRSRDASELIKQYYRCASGYLCKTLWENKIYPCARAASLAELGIYSECPYVDASHNEKLQDRLLNFFMAPTCGPCDYCNFALDEKEYVEPAIQFEKNLFITK